MVVIPSLLKKSHWKVSSLYDLQFYNCPDCNFKVQDKQCFVDHAYQTHPTCTDYLTTIRDGSLAGVICPWMTKENIKIENDFEKLAKKLPKSVSIVRTRKPLSTAKGTK